MRALPVLAASALLAGGTAFLAPQPARAAVACDVEYNVSNEWGSGFTSQVTINNTGDALGSWSLTFDFTGGQQLTHGWSAQWSQSGTTVTAQNASWNGSLPSGGSITVGFNGTHSGDNPAPTNFAVNGTSCGGTSEPPDDEDPPGDDDPGTGAHVDNPYAGADMYVNPEWSENAASEPGGEAIADEPTAVWLDRIAAIEGGGSANMGLREHLDEALAQGANAIQIVVYNLPGRDCAALASNGELGPEEIGRYKNDFIDPISNILDDEEYTELRIIAVIEIDSLPNLITNTGDRDTATDLCDTMKENGNYVEGVAYALSQLGEIPNVYNYIDAAHHGWIGWEDNFSATAELFHETATSYEATIDDVDGFAANVANYSALREPYFDVTDTVNGTSVRQSAWVDWNNYVDELSFAQAFREELVSVGFNEDVGMIIDTSRNGWGGPERPTGPGPQTDVDAYVDGSRIDRRIHIGNWCNQSGAGLGERPTAAPEPGIDAYAWIKPPGESDGSSEEIPNDEGKGFDRMCDPTYGGNPRNGNNPTGALPNAPISGHWFSAQFQQLLENAYPPVQ